MRPVLTWMTLAEASIISPVSHATWLHDDTPALLRCLTRVSSSFVRNHGVAAIRSLRATLANRLKSHKAGLS